jgi:TetR/AcrR family transcriptional regulator, transcriptional repressor of aconitase
VHPLFAASIEAATAAGDLKSGSIASANRFWFGQHVASMVAFVLLPGRASVPYQGTPAALVEEASRFILRGIGMKEGALTAALAADAKRPFQLAPA